VRVSPNSRLSTGPDSLRSRRGPISSTPG
jgi:hypothetical protein